MAVTQDMNLNANGGVLYEFGNEYIVRGVLSTPKVEELGKAVVKTVNNFPVTLEDIADVKIGPKAPKLGTASERGKPAVLMTVTKQPATSTLELTDKLEASLQDLQKNLPADVKVSTDIFRQSRFIESSIGNVQKSLFEGGIFVVIVLFLFLANVRTTVISLVTLPLSLITSLVTLHYMGFTINTMSLGGMAIAIGSLVDDAIVVLDPRGLITYWNRAACDILGYSTEEALGRNLHALIVPQRHLDAHHAAFPGFQGSGQGTAVGRMMLLHACRKAGVVRTAIRELPAIRMEAAGFYRPC